MLTTVQAQLRRLCSYALFAGVSTRVNALKLPFMIEYRPDFHMRNDFSEYEHLHHAWTQGNKKTNGGDFARFYALYQNLKQVLADNVPGDLVELGVYRGNSAALLATLGRKAGRHTWLFDTFEGFDPRDLKGIDDKSHYTSFTNTSLSNVKKLVGEDSVTYVQGYFPASLDQVRTPEKIAVVHIDCDLHEPMRAALETFYPRVQPGGVIIMHDYSSGHWPGATAAIDTFFNDKPEKPVLIPDKSGTAIVRKV
jgi:predicted O-methyltransferase YrrM